MTRRNGLAAVVATLVALAGAPAASGQGPAVQAVDGTEADNYNNRWSPATVTIKAGASVTWSFAGSTVFHNVVSTGSNWSFRNGDPAIGPPPASHSFSTPGTYGFVCQIHATTMIGQVVVTDAAGNAPPAPPPPPLSEQPFPNTAASPTAWETADTLRPRLRHVRARPRGHAARIRFRIDEPAVVTLHVQRAGVTVARRRALVLRGTRSLSVRRLRPGRYRVAVRARDLAGNSSRVRRARLRIS